MGIEFSEQKDGAFFETLINRYSIKFDKEDDENSFFGLKGDLEEMHKGTL